MRYAAFFTLLSHWRRHPVQLATLCAGLALATALWTAVQAINSEAKASYARAAAMTQTPQYATLTAKNGLIPLSQYTDLVRHGWRLSPVLEGRWISAVGPLRVLGIEMLTHPPLPALSPAENAPDPIGFLTLPGQLAASTATASALANAPATSEVFATDNLPDGMVLTDIATAAKLLKNNHSISRLIISDQQQSGLIDLSVLTPDLILSAANTPIGPAALADSFHLNLTAFALLAFTVGLFIVHGAIGLAAEQRRATLRSLRALGLPWKEAVSLLMAELLLLALLSGLAGVCLGYFAAGALLPGVDATLQGLYGAAQTNSLSIRSDWILSGIAMSLFGAIAAGSHTLWKISRLPLLSAPGVHAWAEAASTSTKKLALTGLCLIGGGFLALQSGGLIAGFTFLSGILLGVALCLPLALATVARAVARRSQSPLAEWFWSDLQAQLPGLSLALMALLLALTANIGVSTMAGSFRLAFQTWMDQRLSAQIYVTVQTDAQAGSLVDWAADQDIAALPLRSAEGTYGQRRLEIYGVVNHPSYRSHWPMLSAGPEPWGAVAAGTGILISEQLARREDIDLADPFALTPSASFKVVGIYSDYGNPHGQVVVSMAQLDTLFPGIPSRRFALHMDTTRVEDIINLISQEPDFKGTNPVNQSAVKARALSIFDRTFLVTDALGILTLAVAGFAIFTNLLTLWDRRLSQLAPLLALGVTRRHLAILDLARSLVLALLTFLIALPLGLVLAWILLKIINPEAFGWQLPLHFFPDEWLKMAILSITAAAIAAAIPCLRLWYLQPAALLGGFNNER